MLCKNSFFLFLFCLFSGIKSFSQSATFHGIILNEQNEPVTSATIQAEAGIGTQSNENGFFELEIPANKEISITISHLSYKKFHFRIILRENEVFEFNPVLKTEVEQFAEILISSDRKKVSGITFLDPELLRKIPGANPGVENLLKTLPGVNSNNEMSTQYFVRGGNYDENLVYINGIEVYRPFLIRSGQQEGLSFINPELVREVKFSAGGFPAKYGDKLSSVLDITYKRPNDFSGSLDVSFLGVSAAVEGISKNGKLTAISGLRYRDNSIFVKAKETETNFQPAFSDFQTYLTYRLNENFELGFLGTISVNEYNYRPLTRQTNFGTMEEPLALLVFYNGREEDVYKTYLGALKASWRISENYSAHFISSAYNTREQEYYDILAQYQLEQVDAEIGEIDLGEVEFSEGIGSQLTHARNDLDALIVNLEHKGNFLFEDQQLDYGIKFTRENIRDRIREYELIDSAGFSLRPPLPDFQNNQPYKPFEAPILPFRSIRAQNVTEISRISGFIQWSKEMQFGEQEIWLNLGVRNHNWRVKSEEFSSEIHSVVSPRAQFVIKPNWKKDMLFRLSGGLYHQPPFYQELRDFSGKVNPKVKAQQAIHVVLGNDYSFTMWERPFRLSSEAYYKNLSDVNTYTLENVRIRYSANNDAKAYAYGLDLRLNGEFVPGTESWFSFGYLKTEENSNGRGYIARPTDQRLKFGLLFQDYVPTIPDIKLYLNMVYNTGLPGGSPAYADPYLYQSRLPDYKRADLGIFYVLKDKKEEGEIAFLDKFEEVTIGFEIFNMFNVQNSITNTFVRDVYSKKQYAVPNYLSPRIFNLRISLEL